MLMVPPLARTATGLAAALAAALLSLVSNDMVYPLWIRHRKFESDTLCAAVPTTPFLIEPWSRNQSARTGQRPWIQQGITIGRNGQRPNTGDERCLVSQRSETEPDWLPFVVLDLIVLSVDEEVRHVIR